MPKRNATEVLRDERRPSKKARQDVSSFKCVECNRSFGSQGALSQHLNSSIHVPVLGNIRHSSKAAPVQQATSKAVKYVEIAEYIGIPSSIVKPAWAAALQLRFGQPQPIAEDIVKLTKSNLDDKILSSLISAAVRTLPLETTPEGVALRKEKLSLRQAVAKLAEDTFCKEFSRLGYEFLRESEQKGEQVTPDIRFKQPELICGHLCYWLEYKDYFGFRANPFLASTNKKQLKKYVAALGPGAVVYSLGFETDHVQIDGVRAFRENEVMLDLLPQNKSSQEQLLSG